jgi:hypothetical protein
MAKTVHNGTRNSDKDTDSPPVTKAGLDEGNQGLTESGGSDTDGQDKAKVGIGED